LQPEIRNEARHEIRTQYMSAAKARDWLGWQPAYDMQTALCRTIDWYREHFSEQRAS
jgi:nucleoside-diphosphate-sugar epimerase